MLQQLMAPNRFISLASPDPDDSDTDIEPTEPTIPDKTGEDVSVDSDQSVYFDALETDDDTPYFQQGAEPSPKRAVGNCRTYRFLRCPGGLANKPPA